MTSFVPQPLTSGHLCPDCKGTGADIARTLMTLDKPGHVRCWACLGNGLDPAEYFTWSKTPTPPNHEGVCSMAKFVVCKRIGERAPGQIVSVFGSRNDAEQIAAAFNRDTEHNDGYTYYVIELGQHS